jgi:hypothetical protein
MSNNLANLMVGFGLDLSALQKDAPEAFRILNSQTLSMSAEMKRASREGAESFRLIDEALGIHVSRPLTRILTQEFPLLAQGLQTVLGGAIFGALATVGVEAFDKISERIEKAQKAQEAYAEAVRHTGDVIGDLGASHARTMQELSLELAAKQDQPGAAMKLADFKIDTGALDQAKKGIGEIADAFDKEAKAAGAAAKPFTQFMAALGFIKDNFFSMNLGADESAKKFDAFKRTLDEIMRASSADPLAGVRESLQRVNAEMSTTGADIAAKMALLQHQQSVGFTFDVPGSPGVKQPPVDRETLASNQKYFEMLKAQRSVIEDILREDTARRGLATQPDMAQQMERQRQAMEALQKDISGGLGKFGPEFGAAADPLQKLMTEVTGLRMQAINDFRAIQESKASALDTRIEGQRLDEYLHKLDQVVEKARLNADIANAQAALAKIPIAGAPLPAGIAQTPNIPQPRLQLAPQLADLQELKKVQTDANEAWAEAGKILAEIETPEQKYETGLRVLQTLEQQGRITTEQFAAAQQKLQEQLAESTNKLELLLRKTGDASAGFEAFILQLNKSGSQQGAFTFDILNKGLQGFEDQTVNALTGGKTAWAKYFEELDQMALKFVLNKGIAQLMQASGISNLFGPPQGQQPGSTTSPGTSLGGGAPLSPFNLPQSAFAPLSSLITGGGGAGGTATLAAAGTQLTTGSSLLISAATTLQTAATTLSASGIGAGAGSGGGFDIASAIPGFAGGTDDAPGGMAWVGEQGPELENVPAGASITPASQVRTGSSTHNWYIDARGNEEVGDRIQQALAHAVPLAEQRAINAVNEIQQRTPH